SGYIFYPGIAGQGTHQIKYTVTDAKGCTSDSTRTTEVKKASGVITGIDPGNQYCYDGITDTLRFESSVPWISGHFSGPGISDLSAGTGTFTPSLAGPGDHRIVFSYIDMTFTPFEVAQIVNVDSVGQVIVENLDSGSVFCTGDTPFTLYTNREGGVFTGPVTGNNFDPSKGPGSAPVIYTYVNSRTGCSSSASVPVIINPSPDVAFTVADFCIEHSDDTTRFLNNTTSADPVSSWAWEFRDGGGVMISDHESPGYLYLTGGLHQVKLTAITINNCSSSLEKTIDLGVKPEADFYWLNECFHADDSVYLFDRTLTGSPVTSRTWNFFDGNPLLTSLNPRYPKLAEGFLPVEYIVYTNYADCGDTVSKEIFIRPTIKLSGDDYFENFESGPGGWIADQGDINTWSFGMPDRPNINSAASGLNAWYTSYDIAAQTLLSSSVTSPCFDFSETDRPMISMKLWRRFDRNRDGAAIQYKVGDYSDWEYLGTLGDGIEWFNSTLIKGRPGGDQIGWTTLSSQDADWTEARRRLDELNGKRDVKFRIAYGSDGTSQENDGFAFDDIRIGTRTRNVLLEHFTNNSSSSVVNANLIVNAVASAMKRDVININYHTNFPGTDLLYNDIPADMSARVLFYGLPRVPYSLIDGGTRNQFAGIYDYLVADLDSTELNKRSLIAPHFMIETDPIVSGGLLQVGARITALEELDEENLTLYVAVTAREITTVVSPNGELVFHNTLRKMLPDAGGTKLPKVWSTGQIYDSPDFSWKITNIYDARDIEIIAFIQNNNTRKIYQATGSGINDISVGVESVYGDNAAFSLFPNPTAERLVISFSEPLLMRTAIEIIDLTGKVVHKFNAESGQSTLEIDNIGLINGVYVVRMISGNITGGQRKLIISGVSR
ncbi:MAG: T9SS type A sorting domain-containing protein, partial [Bacteroidales bacterium]